MLMHHSIIEKTHQEQKYEKIYLCVSLIALCILAVLTSKIWLYILLGLCIITTLLFMYIIFRKNNVNIQYQSSQDQIIQYAFDQKINQEKLKQFKSLNDIKSKEESIQDFVNESSQYSDEDIKTILENKVLCDKIFVDKEIKDVQIICDLYDKNKDKSLATNDMIQFVQFIQGKTPEQLKILSEIVKENNNIPAVITLLSQLDMQFLLALSDNLIKFLEFKNIQNFSLDDIIIYLKYTQNKDVSKLFTPEYNNTDIMNIIADNNWIFSLLQYNPYNRLLFAKTIYSIMKYKLRPDRICIPTGYEVYEDESVLCNEHILKHIYKTFKNGMMMKECKYEWKIVEHELKLQYEDHCIFSCNRDINADLMDGQVLCQGEGNLLFHILANRNILFIPVKKHHKKKILLFIKHHNEYIQLPLTL